MRTVFLLCAAFALKVSTPEPVKEKEVVPQKKTQVENPGNLTRTAERMTKPVLVTEPRYMKLNDVMQSGGRCVPGFYSYGSRCFGFFNKPMAWIDAEMFCLYFGANLASVHNPLEYEFIQNYVNLETGQYAPAWIGGSDAVRTGSWLWSDGSVFNYVNWANGEPNNNGGNEHCIQMNAAESMWNDLSCEHILPFVCGTRPKESV